MSVLSKTEVRKSIGKILRAIAPQTRLDQSNSVFDTLLTIPQYTQAKTVGLYLSMKTEVETRPIIDHCNQTGKRIVVPKIISDYEFEFVSLDICASIDALPKDKWGIPIPVLDDDHRMLEHPEFTPDVIIVPGVAFDTQCQRMGHGKGYYDRCFEFLKSWCESHNKSYPTLIGIAFDEQIIDSVPCHAHDIPLDMIITPTKLYKRD